MAEDRLELIYDSKSNIELLFIALNYDGGYTNEAIQAANRLLSSRYSHFTDAEALWNEEVTRLSQLAQQCCICQNPDVVYASEFYLRRHIGTDVKGSIPRVALGTVLGLGLLLSSKLLTKEKYEFLKLVFKLCPQCLAKRTKQKKGKNEVKISFEDYYSHPLFSVYRLMGYTEVQDKV